jgi:hypothetical protein
MLLFLSTQTKVAIVITLLIVWAYNSYEKRHPAVNPLITNSYVVKNQNDHRNISRPWHTLDLHRNLQAKQTG